MQLGPADAILIKDAQNRRRAFDTVGRKGLVADRPARLQRFEALLHAFAQALGHLVQNFGAEVLVFQPVDQGRLDFRNQTAQVLVSLLTLLLGGIQGDFRADAFDVIDQQVGEDLFISRSAADFGSQVD